MTVPRPLLRIGAVVFVAALTSYSVGLIYYLQHSLPTGTIGATYEFMAADRTVRVNRLTLGGPAQRAGLQNGDLIVAVNGRQSTSLYPFWDVIERGKPGATVQLTVRRPGESASHDVAVRLDAAPVPTRVGPTVITGTHIAALRILALYPVPFLIVAAVVLTQRSTDRHAWVLAIMFAGFIVGSALPNLEPVMHPALRKPLIAYWALFALAAPGALYCFFATFPERTPPDRWLPWLKWILLGVPLAVGASLSIVTMLTPGRPSFLAMPPHRLAIVAFAVGIYSIVAYGLGLGSLVWNAFRGQLETRRRTRVILWGTAGALLPITILGSYVAIRGMEVVDLPFWLWVGAILATYLLPVSFAYAVIKHRVMDIPVLLRRSARYVAVRHAIVTVGILAGIGVTFVFALVFAQSMPDQPARVTSPGPLSAVAGAVFGVLVAVTTRSGVRRATHRLDRAFFREAYDARRLLQDLARRTRVATDRRELARLLEESLTHALHPSSTVVILRTADDRLEPFEPHPGIHLNTMDIAAAEIELSARRGAGPVISGRLPDSLARLSDPQPDLVVAIQGHDERLEGLLLLGPRLSDEPYGEEDRELVASVAGQAGIALQNLRLAGVIAERLEAERRAERELEIAREIQANLLPQHAPVVPGLDCAGRCIQARRVGGDYYDFLQLGPGRLGLVLADISGKGMGAALLMASLQASVRGEFARAPTDLSGVLQAVNRTFFVSTAPHLYATLFAAIYDETTRVLRYANCGHVPPIVRAHDGATVRLSPTATAIGLFEECTCTTREIDLGPRDMLVIFSDGVVEAFNTAGEEFGEARLLALLQQHADLTAAPLIDRVVRAVQSYADPVQSDDVTLVVVRARDLAEVQPGVHDGVKEVHLTADA